ncbi:MAG: tetratricopeptide repeat protein [Spirochaetia bacterium]|jgi:TolA-binding protein
MKKRIIHLVLACLLCSVPLFAEAKLGSVKSFSGDVTIDAFGKGTFIKVIVGDALYASTVLSAGPDGRATVDVQGTMKEIPPGARVKISDLMSASAKKGGLAWFAAVGKLIKSFSEASQAKEEDLVMASRATEAAPKEETGMEWEGDTDASSILPEARKTIDAGDFNAALQKLGKAEMPSDPALAFELLYWKGFCYFQLEDYPDATACFSDAYARMGPSRNAVSTLDQRSFLLFQLGSSYFFLGKEKEAVPVLAEYLADNADAPLAPYATLLLARSLASSGDAGRARSLASAAAKKYKGTDLESEFASLQK